MPPAPVFYLRYAEFFVLRFYPSLEHLAFQFQSDPVKRAPRGRDVRHIPDKIGHRTGRLWDFNAPGPGIRCMPDHAGGYGPAFLQYAGPGGGEMKRPPSNHEPCYGLYDHGCGGPAGGGGREPDAQDGSRNGAGGAGTARIPRQFDPLDMLGRHAVACGTVAGEADPDPDAVCIDPDGAAFGTYGEQITEAGGK